MKILVTGGAGYIGSTLVPELLALGHEVTVYDNLRFGGQGMLGLFKNPKFNLIKADVRDIAKLKEATKSVDAVIHLAAIVGYPACKNEPELATAVNVGSTKALASFLSKDQYILFGSTGSNYGVITDGVCTEETPLSPLSHYGRTKTEAERIVMNECTATAYRFATAFGLSPRLRLDLLVNDFVNKALNDRYIVVYESHFMRTFIHVHDIARSFVFALENRDNMEGQVYNVGDDNMNCSKKGICEMIGDKVDYYLHLADFGSDADKRNYIVSYDKIASLGYRTTINLEAGVDELVAGLQAIKVANPYSNV
tara:strand:+ start:497 stop:1426 length:930 start_codon:yes stop_codon:yes gene_type:complete